VDGSTHLEERGKDMGTVLFIIAAILVLFWIIGVVAHIMGALIHVLLVIAIIAAIVGFLTRD
jgi:hypothetical protein